MIPCVSLRMNNSSFLFFILPSRTVQVCWSVVCYLGTFSITFNYLKMYLIPELLCSRDITGIFGNENYIQVFVGWCSSVGLKYLKNGHNCTLA